MVHTAGLNKRWWGAVVQAEIYLKNRSSTQALSESAPITMKTPYEVWHGEALDISNPRVFGCTAYLNTPERNGARKLIQSHDVVSFSDVPIATTSAICTIWRASGGLLGEV